MNANEIYELLFNSSWKSSYVKGIVKFIKTGTDGFDIVIIQNGETLERYQFANYRLNMTEQEMIDPKNKQLIFEGQPSYYILVLSDDRILVNLPGLSNLIMKKSEE